MHGLTWSRAWDLVISARPLYSARAVIFRSRLYKLLFPKLYNRCLRQLICISARKRDNRTAVVMAVVKLSY